MGGRRPDRPERRHQRLPRRAPRGVRGGQRPGAERLPPAGERDRRARREPDSAAAAADGSPGRHRAGHRHLGFHAVEGGAAVGQGRPPTSSWPAGLPTSGRRSSRSRAPRWCGRASRRTAAALGAAIDALEPVGETALWDALTTAAHLYDQRPDLQPNLVLLSDGADSISTGHGVAGGRPRSGRSTPPSSPSGSPRTSSTPPSSPVWSERPAARPAPAGDPADLSAQFARIRSAVENQYEVTYRSTAAGGALSPRPHRRRRRAWRCRPGPAPSGRSPRRRWSSRPAACCPRRSARGILLAARRPGRRASSPSPCS